MRVLRLTNDKYFSSNVYIYINNGRVIIIDLGFYDERIRTILSDLEVEGVILTHKHFDHIQGLKAFQNDYKDVKIFTRIDKNNFLNDPYLNCSRYMCENGDISYDLENIVPLNEGELTLGCFNFDIVFTPGHCSDCIILIDDKNNVIFSGDFIFSTSIGRMDLPTSNQIDMYNSLVKFIPIIKRKNYLIYSGHDDLEFTSESLLKFNSYLKRFN